MPYRVNEKVSTPTSVILMAFTSCCGKFVQISNPKKNVMKKMIKVFGQLLKQFKYAIEVGKNDNK